MGGGLYERVTFSLLVPVVGEAKAKGYRVMEVPPQRRSPCSLSCRWSFHAACLSGGHALWKEWVPFLAFRGFPCRPCSWVETSRRPLCLRPIQVDFCSPLLFLAPRDLQASALALAVTQGSPWRTRCFLPCCSENLRKLKRKYKPVPAMILVQVYVRAFLDSVKS